MHVLCEISSVLVLNLHILKILFQNCIEIMDYIYILLCFDSVDKQYQNLV